jgi:hypothetical protein
MGFDTVFERTYRAGFHQSPKGEKHERKKEEHMKKSCHQPCKLAQILHHFLKANPKNNPRGFF